MRTVECGIIRVIIGTRLHTPVVTKNLVLDVRGIVEVEVEIVIICEGIERVVHPEAIFSRGAPCFIGSTENILLATT